MFMNEFEKFLEQLQNLRRNTKIKIIWIGAPLTTALIIYSWFTFVGFGINETVVKKSAESEKISKLEIFKNGFKVTIQELQSFAKTAKEKISQTNSFNIEAPKNEDNEILKTAEVKDVFKVASVEVENGNPAKNSVFEIKSVEIGATTTNE